MSTYMSSERYDEQKQREEESTQKKSEWMFEYGCRHGLFPYKATYRIYPWWNSWKRTFAETRQSSPFRGDPLYVMFNTVSGSLKPSSFKSGSWSEWSGLNTLTLCTVLIKCSFQTRNASTYKLPATYMKPLCHLSSLHYQILHTITLIKKKNFTIAQ